ncbi:hypothetical protein LTR66_014000, partial [Elasticomyces elasticus]
MAGSFSYNAGRPIPKFDAFDLVSPMSSRSPSSASGRFSVVSGLTSYFPSGPSMVHPPPAYVAQASASQIATEHHYARRANSSDDEGSRPKKEDVARFSESALALVNAFLDQLLYGFLSTARSTSLLALRPAVTDVLKQRLAREAIASAEEELQELLAEGEDEDEDDLDGKESPAARKTRWDLELVWKRTRLRVMVYIRLGEMEDEDEERYVKEEELFHGLESRFSQSTGLVSWSAAIFLTSVLEHVAEQTLQTAGQAAYNRVRRQSRNPKSNPAANKEQVLVEEYDVEKVALNPALGRLWRTWRKSMRSPSAANGRSRSAVGSPSIVRGGSVGPGEGSVISAMDEDDYRRPWTAASTDIPDVPDIPHPEHVLASNIPLPVGTRDVEEIEVPGLAKDPDAHDDGSVTPRPALVTRRSSLSRLPLTIAHGLPTPESSEPQTPAVSRQNAPALSRTRSSSLPTPATSPFAPPTSEDARVEERSAMPGSFWIEPKSNATEMNALALRESAQQRDRSVEPAAPLKALADGERTPTEAQESPQKDEHRGMIVGAIAGVSAAVAAAVTAVVGSHEDANKASNSGNEQQDVSQADAEDWDRRKSRMDIKSMVKSDGTDFASASDAEIMSSSRVSMGKPLGPAELIRHQSGESIHSRYSTVSNRSYTLGNKAKRQELSDAGMAEVRKDNPGNDAQAIGVARTADFYTPSLSLPSTPTRESKEISPEDINSSDETEDPNSRNVQKPSRLILGNSPYAKRLNGSLENLSSTGPAVDSSTREFLASRSLSLKQQSEAPSPLVPTREGSSSLMEQRARSFSGPNPRRAAPPNTPMTNGTVVSPLLEKSPYRKSWSTAFANGDTRPNSYATTISTVSGGGALEHPSAQRIAPLQRNADLGGKFPLTSASITSPEDFESFVQGGETVRYTLTPDNVRDPPPSNRPLWNHNIVTMNALEGKSDVPAAATQESRQPSPPPLNRANSSNESRTGRSTVDRAATSAIPYDRSRNASTVSSNRRSISRPPPRNVSASRKSGLTPREPRIQTESTRDFADFIRSTGPDKEPEVALQFLANRSTTSLHSLRSIQPNSRSQSPAPAVEERSRSLRRVSVGKEQMEAENIPPVPGIPPVKGRPSMQARGPINPPSGSSDLVDFVRTGPLPVNGDLRSPRTVAPPLNTMNSEPPKNLGVHPANRRPEARGKPADAGPGGYDSNTMLATSSYTSANPRTAPLGNGPPRANPSSPSPYAHPAYNQQPQRLMNPNRGPVPTSQSTLSPVPPTGGVLERKRHRNKDPYAIDVDSEDDDLLTTMPQSRRQEESLADFLRNVDPPNNNAPRPI